jgi:hypothetical protein
VTAPRTLLDRLDRLDRPAAVVGLCVAAYLPFVLLGYGTDIDVGSVLQSGRDWLDDGVYRVSRPPGAAVHEVTTGALDEIGGYALVNLASVGFGALALWGVHQLLRRAGSPVATPAVLVLASNPWFWIASTSLGDFVWSAGLVVGGAAVAARPVDQPRGTASGDDDVSDRSRAVAGLLFALGTGCRLTAGVLVVAWLVAERVGAPSSRPPWRATIITAAVAGAGAVLGFVPSWLWADGTLDFLDSGLPFDGIGTNVGRWGVKNVAFFGVLAIPVLVAGLPRLFRASSAWATSVVFRFGLLAFVATEVLYLRYPLKTLHLLPAAVALALVVGHLGERARRWILVLVAAQLIGGLVTTTIAAPDVEDRADSGRIELGLTDGPLLNDVRCRLDDLDDGRYVDGRSPESRERAAANFDCQLSTWRADD